MANGGLKVMVTKEILYIIHTHETLEKELLTDFHIKIHTYTPIHSHLSVVDGGRDLARSLGCWPWVRFHDRKRKKREDERCKSSVPLEKRCSPAVTL